MQKIRKIFGISIAILGVAFMYIATAFIIPFPTEFLTLAIASILPGGITVINMKYAFVFEWIVGVILLGLGYVLYTMSPDEVALKPKKVKRGK